MTGAGATTGAGAVTTGGTIAFAEPTPSVPDAGSTEGPASISQRYGPLPALVASQVHATVAVRPFPWAT